LAEKEKNSAKQEEYLQKALAIAPHDMRVLSEAALFYASDSEKRYEQAEKFALEAVKLDEGATRPYVVLAEVYANMQRWEDLDAIVNQSHKNVPDDFGIYYQAGKVLAFIRQKPTTSGTLLLYFRTYLTIDPEGGEPPLAAGRWRLGQVLARTHLAPEIQARADALRPLAHAGHAKVAGLSAGLQYLGVDPLAIVTHTQTKLILIVPDIHFDAAGSGVCEGVPDHLADDTVDLVLEHWRYVLLLAFAQDAIAWSPPIQFVSRRQFTASGIQQLRKVALRCRFRAQVTNGGTPLLDRYLRCENRVVNRLHRVIRFSQQQFTSRLELEGCPLETLEHGVNRLRR
jgi:tetratricopeptide (TPR) repeat protein